MSWINALCETYEKLKDSPELLKRCSMPLAPPSHTVQNAHAEIFLNESGELLRIRPLTKSEARTITPCTEDSAVRSSNNAPHIVYDNLKYIAGDAQRYIAKQDNSKNYEKYCSQLSDWCNDENCPNQVKAIYKYIKRGTVFHDLIESGLILPEEKLKWNGDKDNKPADISKTVVRFRVEDKYGNSFECNTNSELMNSYMEYDRKNRKQKSICFVSGTTQAVTYKHPTKIRTTGDSARLISANDEYGFTYRGRFKNKENVFSVGFESSDKAHSALRWLVSNQGFSTGDQTVVVWCVGGEDIPTPLQDTYDITAGGDPFGDEAPAAIYNSERQYAKLVELAVNGYKYKIPDNDNVIIMILESATPGRLSITYYREFSPNDYLDRIKTWHTTCVWNHKYKLVSKILPDGKQELKHIEFTGAPSINDIIYAAYGRNVDEKQKKHLMEILISCITDGKRMPKDFMNKSLQRVSNPQSFNEDWELSKATSITCSIINKYIYDTKGMNYSMSLDKSNKDRSYLFGRVLAYAEQIEDYVLYKSGDKRPPNAIKLRSKYRIQPAKTLMVIDEKLLPYVEKLYSSSTWLYDEMQKVIAEISANDFMNNKPLDPQYLLGYACQKAELLKKHDKKDETKETEEN